MIWFDFNRPPTQNHPESPLGGTDTDKQNSSAQLACVCLTLGHLAAKIYFNFSTKKYDLWLASLFIFLKDSFLKPYWFLTFSYDIRLFFVLTKSVLHTIQCYVMPCYRTGKCYTRVKGLYFTAFKNPIKEWAMSNGPICISMH